MQVLVGACGSGKTHRALEIALNADGTVVYVAPTRAVAFQFAKWLRERGVEVYEAVGRKVDENCTNPLADIAIASGKTHSVVCKVCDSRSVCEYWLARVALENLAQIGGIVVTTMHYIAYADVPIEADYIIYDDINMPIISVIGAKNKSIGALRENSIASIQVGTKKKVGYYVPRLPVGKRETYVVSATPVISFFPNREQIVWQPEIALDQSVSYYLFHLTHSSRWYAPPGTCGFKRNTSPGLPYFNASVGLNEWRGISLTVAGSFQPPLNFLFVLARLLEQIHHEAYGVDFVPCEFLFDNRKKLYSAMWVVHNGNIIADVSCLPSIYPLVQLLGRAGVGVSCKYYGDIPLNFRLWDDKRGNVEIRLVRKAILEQVSEDVALFHSRRWNVALALHGKKSVKSLNSEERKYLNLVKRIMENGINEVFGGNKAVDKGIN